MIGDTIEGVRLDDAQAHYHDGAPPGEAFYGRDDTGTWRVWIRMPESLRTEHGPRGWGGILTNHTVMEHEDGTITVTPSILIGPAGDSPGWHGFLEHGVFREV